MNQITQACAVGVLIGAALFGFAKHANAEIIAYTQNTVGGTIQFSNTPCKDGSGLGAVVIDSGGEATLGGCWLYAEPNISVVWSTGERRFYSAANVTLTEAGKKTSKPAPRGSM